MVATKKIESEVCDYLLRIMFLLQPLLVDLLTETISPYKSLATKSDRLLIA